MDVRRRVAGDLGRPPPPELHKFDPGRSELHARLREAGAEASGALDHVLRVLETEAAAKGTLDFLDGGAFRAERWSRSLARDLADARRPPVQRSDRPRDIRVGRVEPHAPSAYPDGEVPL